MSERTWLRSSLVIGALSLGLAAVPSTTRAQDAAKTDDANKQDSAQPAAGAQQGQGQGQGRRGRGGAGGGGFGGAFGARNPAQAVERSREDTSALTLRDEQKTKLEAIYKEAADQAKSLETETQSLEPRERAQKVMPFMRDLREKVNGVLDEQQRQTLRKNQATRAAKQTTERMKQNLGQLNLTSEQQTKVDAVLADSEKKMIEAAAQAGDNAGGVGGPGGGRGAGGGAFGVMRETRDKINEILTPEQQAKFRELAPQGGRGGGQGGRRGAGGAGGAGGQ